MITILAWFNQLPSASQAALIGTCVDALVGAIATLLTGILRDFVAKWWSDHRDSQRSSDDIYRGYAEPLAAAATSLMWRLLEVFGSDGRGSFLVASEPRTVFEDYKLRSTYYRLAALLGWIRALRRELSFLRLAGKRRIEIIDDAIEQLERSLADGHHVEIKRLEGLLHLWQIPPSSEKVEKGKLAVDVENVVKTTLQHSSVTTAHDLEPDAQLALCRKVVDLLCKSRKTKPLTDDFST